MSAESIDSPGKHYRIFLSQKAEELESLEDEIRGHQFADHKVLLLPHNTRKIALRLLIPNWKSLKTQNDATSLCTSIEEWSQKWNLTDTWIKEFVLYTLSSFKFYNVENYIENEYTILIQEAVRETLTSSILKQKSYIREDVDKFPEFHFRWKSFDFKSKWSPRDETKEDFKDEILKDLRQLKTQIKWIIKTWKEEPWLEEVKVLEENLNTLFNRGLAVKELVQVLDQPSKEGINRLMSKMPEISESLDFSESVFKGKLERYCKKIKKKIPNNWVGVPTKARATF